MTECVRERERERVRKGQVIKKIIDSVYGVKCAINFCGKFSHLQQNQSIQVKIKDNTYAFIHSCRLRYGFEYFFFLNNWSCP